MESGMSVGNGDGDDFDGVVYLRGVRLERCQRLRAECLSVTQFSRSMECLVIEGI